MVHYLDGQLVKIIQNVIEALLYFLREFKQRSLFVNSFLNMTNNTREAQFGV
jgi:hypothetical protein